MKLTYDRIMYTAQMLEDPEMLAGLKKIHLPMRLSLRAASALEAVREHAQRFSRVRQEIIQSYAENGEISKEKVDLVNAEILDATKEEVEIDYEPIDISVLVEQDVSIGIMDCTRWMWKKENRERRAGREGNLPRWGR